MTLALEGIRVLEWSQYQQGPAVGVMLGDLGAEVIKIEEPISGDPIRGVEQRSGLYSALGGRNFKLEQCNRNKKGITLNLKSQEGRQIAYDLAKKCDVFLHNFLDHTARRLGMDYESFSQVNPMLVYVQVSGYGDKGPDSAARCFDYTGLARSAIMTAVGEPNTDPQLIQGGIGDTGGALMGAYATVVGLMARQLHGVGQKVDASMLGFLVWVQFTSVAMQLLGGQPLPKHRRTEQWSPLWNHYKCADGKWLVIACPQVDRYWPGVCRAMGLEDDPRFTDAEFRGVNGPELIVRMDEVFLTKPRAEWMILLRQQDVTCQEVNDFAELVKDPQVLANGYVTDFNHPVWGPVQVPGIPISLEKTPGQIRMAAPELGQHTEEVLIDLLGYDSGHLVDLREKGII